MRLFSCVVVSSLALLVVACGDDDHDSARGAGGEDSSAGGSDDSSGAGEASGQAGTPTSGGSSGSSSRGGNGSTGVEFTDMPGKIRFINYVSDGKNGQALDLYWGSSIGRGERAGTIEYGEITEFMAPRHADDGLLEPDEARFFLVPAGDTSGTPSTFLVQDESEFSEGTVLTIAMSASENSLSDDLVVSERIFYESELVAPPAGMAHVYEWSSAFSQIPSGNFMTVGIDGLCDPEWGDSGNANLGPAFLVPEGSTGLALFDANTVPPCDSGTAPVSGNIEAGHSYVLLGEAETFEIDARKAVLLEVGTAN
jgi:hypothetical protein